MDRKDFLASLYSSSRGLRTSLRGLSADWLDAICSGAQAGSRSKLSPDTVFELMCCFGLLDAVRARVTNLRLIAAPGPNGFRFPMKPGRKTSFAFFRFEHEGRSYDVCCGTAIPIEDEPEEAPDIALEAHGSALPDRDRRHGAVQAIWDAKYHKKAASKSDAQQMQYWCRVFDIQKCCANDLLAQIMPPSFQVSSVITNAPPLRFNRRQMLLANCSVLFNYRGDHTICVPAPTRSDHEKLH